MLQDRAMIAALSRRVWEAAVTDRDIASQAEAINEAAPRTLKVIKTLIPKELLMPIRRIADLGYAEHVKRTVPGLMRGQHLLATAMFEEYCLIQSAIKDRFWVKVNEAQELYPEFITDARKTLGKAFKEEDFPSVRQFRKLFDYDVKFLPVPKIDDWRLTGIGGGDMEKVRSDAEEHVRAMFNNATKELFTRAHDVLAQFVGQLKSHGTPGHGLKPATLEGLKEVSGLLVRMNVTDDEELNRLGYEMIESFMDCEIEKLRTDEQLRSGMAAKVDVLLKRMKDGKQ